MTMLPGPQRAKHAYDRWPRDWYVDPPFCAEMLFEAVRFTGAVHDPCCGGGTIVTVAREAGLTATGSDIADRGFGDPGVDFLSDARRRDNFVFNPPYDKAEAFISRALALAERRVAALVRLPFLAGQRRARELYWHRAPSDVLILSRRPSMPPGGSGIAAKGGTTDYCWIVWDGVGVGPPRLRWLPVRPAER